MPEYTVRLDGAGDDAPARSDPRRRHAGAASTRRRPARCSARSPRRRRTSDTPFHPRSPYACAKVFAYQLTSQLPRGLRPVRLQRHPVQPRVPAPRETSSRARSPARRRASSQGLQDKLFLGNLDAKRDWGFAGDYVEAMWLMLQQDSPTTTSSPPARRTPCASSSTKRSGARPGLEAATSRSIPLLPPRRGRPLLATPARRGRSWAGSRRSLQGADRDDGASG